MRVRYLCICSLCSSSLEAQVLRRAVREGMAAGLSTRNSRRAVESVLEGYGIEKSTVSRQIVAASSNQLRELCERHLEGLNLVVLMIDGIPFGGQVRGSNPPIYWKQGSSARPSKQFKGTEGVLNLSTP